MTAFLCDQMLTYPSGQTVSYEEAIHDFDGTYDFFWEGLSSLLLLLLMVLVLLMLGLHLLIVLGLLSRRIFLHLYKIKTVNFGKLVSLNLPFFKL